MCHPEPAEGSVPNSSPLEGRWPQAGGVLPATRAGIHSIFGMAQRFSATRAGIHPIFGMALYSSPLEGRS